MSVTYEDFQNLQENTSRADDPAGKRSLKGIMMDKWIPQPSPVMICFLSCLCTGFLFIIIILFVSFTRQGVDQVELNMEGKLRNLSMGIHSMVEELSHYGSQMMERLTAMQTFVKSLRKSEMMKNMEEIESLVHRILSDEVSGSFSNDNQKILLALGQLGDEILKGNSSDDPLCDKGWLHNGSSCYLLIRRTQPWSSAKKDCEDKKSHLVVINDNAEMDFLKTFSQKVARSWIGLKEEESVWKWVDGTSYDTTPKFWQRNELDYWDIAWKTQRYGGWVECGQLTDGNAWTTSHCSEGFPYICEKKMS